MAGAELDLLAPGSSLLWVEALTLISMRHETICSSWTRITGGKGVGFNLETNEHIC